MSHDNTQPGPIVTPPTTPEIVDPGSSPSLSDQVLFGSSGGTAGIVAPTATPQTGTVQQGSLNWLLQTIQNMLAGGDPANLAGHTTSVPGQFPGGQMPGVNPLMAMSLEGLQNVASGSMDVFTGDIGAASRQALIDLLGGGVQDTSGVFDATVGAPAQQDLKRALEELNLNAVGSGTLFSGGANSRPEIAARTGEDFLDAMMRERTRYQYDAETRAMENQLGALGIAPSISGMDTALGQELYGAGQTAWGNEVQQWAADLAMYQEDRNREDQLLQMLLGGSVAPTFGVSGGFALPNTASSSGGLIGAFLSGFGDNT